jgi:DMSO/TMAO reductase YedYZ molybdopterin-dependent catalytic subunit
MDFPVWLRATHWLNLLFLGFLVRAGIQIFAAYPRLYWRDGCVPGTEWLKFTRHEIPADRPWTTLGQEVAASSVLALPGGKNLGLGRHWHFVTAMFWLANGVAYVLLLFASGEAGRLLPDSPRIMPDAASVAWQYLTLHHPAEPTGDYNALQKLTYASVVFLLAPFEIMTGFAQSPAVDARFPWLLNVMGGRQGVRSLHFAGLIALVAFTVVHTVVVAYTGLGSNLGKIFAGDADYGTGRSVLLTAVMLGIFAAIWWAAGAVSLKRARTIQRLLMTATAPLRFLLTAVRTPQHLPASSVSAFFPVNGLPPNNEAYERSRDQSFDDWRLEITGLVEQQLCLTVAQLRELGLQHQLTRHHCIQGWSAIAAWAGVPVAELMALCRPLAEARYVNFVSCQQDEASGGPYHETLDLDLASQPQTIVALEMNGRPLTREHGAPLRLRVETQLGFKMVKWLCRIEFIHDLPNASDGMGGTREDTMHYERVAPI